MRAFFSSSSTTLPTPRSSNRSKRRRRTFSDDRSCFLNRRLRRRSLVVTNTNKSTTTQTLLPLRTLSPPSMKNNTIMNEVSSVSAAASRTKTATASASPTRVPILNNNNNLPIAFAIMFGFGTISAVLYPASKAMEKAMRATEIAMNETTKLMERDALRAFNEGEQASLEWQELGKELRVLLKNIERWGKPLVGDANSLESFDLNLLGESMKDSLAEILEKSLIGIGGGNMNNNNSTNSNNTQLGGINLVQQSIDENLFKWQDAITDVIEDLTNLRLEAASKGQTANEETLKRALNQAKVASESFLISSGNNRTGDDEEEDPATNLIRKVSSSFDEQNDDFDIRTRAASEKLRAESRAKQESMDSF